MPQNHNISRPDRPAPQAAECCDVIEPFDLPAVKPATLTIALPTGEEVIVCRDADGCFAQTSRNGTGIAIAWSPSILRVLDAARDYIARELRDMGAI